jgi:hypothetical protein
MMVTAGGSAAYESDFHKKKVAAWGYQKRKAQVLSGYTRRSG